MHAYFSDITYIYKRIFEKEKFIMLNVENKLQKTKTKFKTVEMKKLNIYLPLHSFPFNLKSMHTHENLCQLECLVSHMNYCSGSLLVYDPSFSMQSCYSDFSTCLVCLWVFNTLTRHFHYGQPSFKHSVHLSEPSVNV